MVVVVDDNVQLFVLFLSAGKLHQQTFQILLILFVSFFLSSEHQRQQEILDLGSGVRCHGLTHIRSVWMEAGSVRRGSKHGVYSWGIYL